MLAFTLYKGYDNNTSGALNALKISTIMQSTNMIFPNEL